MASEQPCTAKSSHIRPRAELQETRRRAAHPLQSWGASTIREHGTLLWSGGYLQASLHPSPDGSDRGWMSTVSEHSAAMLESMRWTNGTDVSEGYMSPMDTISAVVISGVHEQPHSLPWLPGGATHGTREVREEMNHRLPKAYLHSHKPPYRRVLQGSREAYKR